MVGIPNWVFLDCHAHVAAQLRGVGQCCGLTVRRLAPSSKGSKRRHRASARRSYAWLLVKLLASFLRHVRCFLCCWNTFNHRTALSFLGVRGRGTKPSAGRLIGNDAGYRSSVPFRNVERALSLLTRPRQSGRPGDSRLRREPNDGLITGDMLGFYPGRLHTPDPVRTPFVGVPFVPDRVGGSRHRAVDEIASGFFWRWCRAKDRSAPDFVHALGSRDPPSDGGVQSVRTS